MQNNIPMTSVPLIPYEFTVPYVINIYDNLPYIRDIDLCNRTGITLHSGNIIKTYRYMTSSSYEVDHNKE